MASMEFIAVGRFLPGNAPGSVTLGICLISRSDLVPRSSVAGPSLVALVYEVPVVARFQPVEFGLQ